MKALAGFAAVSSLPGCANIYTVEPTAATSATQAVLKNAQPVPAGAMTAASVAVSSTALASIGAGFAGLSYEKSTLTEPLFSASNTNLIGLFQRLGPSLLRIGGSSVDRSVWTPNGAGQTAGEIAPSDVASLAAFVKAAGWQCLYGINLGGVATGATTPALAAAEVAYAAEVFGSSLSGIEIGNECDEYGSVGSYFPGDWSLGQFQAIWSEFRSAILAVSPNVAITGPASGENEAKWTVPFGEAAGKSEISMLTQHYYRGSGLAAGLTCESLVAPDPALTANLAILKAGAEAIGVPYRMAECNSYYSGGAFGISDAYASSLWAIDFLFNLAAGGASGCNFQGGDDTQGYTPIADADGVVVGPRPEYYGILLFTLAGQGTMCQTTVAAGSLNVTAYAVQSASGGWNVVVVNKEQTNLQMTVSLPNQVSTATLMAMTQLSANASGPALAATSGVMIQGAAVGTSGSFAPADAYTLAADGTVLTCYVPALSAVLIQVS